MQLIYAGKNKMDFVCIDDADNIPEEIRKIFLAPNRTHNIEIVEQKEIPYDRKLYDCVISKKGLRDGDIRKK